MDTVAAERAHDRLRATLAAHDTGEGVYFDSRAWIVTALRDGDVPRGPSASRPAARGR
ncbi:hypothetical protein ABZ639_19990 [Saccharomonospora sp. NPDC006951]